MNSSCGIVNTSSLTVSIEEEETENHNKVLDFPSNPDNKAIPYETLCDLPLFVPARCLEANSNGPHIPPELI
jgi:hypothetical protein